MDLRFTREELAFRDEVRSFLSESVPSALRAKLLDGGRPTKEEQVAWQRILNGKGWAVPFWPAQYGGADWTAVQQYILMEELQLAPAPLPLAFNVNMVGPVIYTFGSEEQKRHYLPRIANLDDWWCQGFSEPGAGSDLASLTTRAERQGDIYLVNGQKTWTTYAHHADWIFCLCRTDSTAKKQVGISFILIDLKSRGVTVRPIQTIDGGYEFNEIFFDNVEVPRTNLVGEENKGWDYAKFLLSNERVNLARVGHSKERLRRIKSLAGKIAVGDKLLSEDPRFIDKLVATEIELKVLEITQMRVVVNDGSHNKRKGDPASSILKLKGTEIQQAVTELLLDVAGPFALPYAPDDRCGCNEADDWNAQIASNYFHYRKVSIYGGSNEIQRNIIAKTVLGL